jgi:hypothetical protein
MIKWVSLDFSLLYFHSYLFDVIDLYISLYNFGQTWDALTLKKIGMANNLEREYSLRLKSYDYVHKL